MNLPKAVILYHRLKLMHSKLHYYSHRTGVKYILSNDSGSKATSKPQCNKLVSKGTSIGKKLQPLTMTENRAFVYCSEISGNMDRIK